MSTLPPGTTPATAGGVGPLLRAWREQRRVSQLGVALRADSSARHISFIETGRSRPSEQMVLRLAEHLDVPVRERNALLLAAGYAPRFPETPLDDPALDALREGIERLIGGYEPYPALVVDAMYDVVAANRGVMMLFDGVPESLLVPPLNAVRLTLHPQGLAPRIRNWRSGAATCWSRWSGRSRSAAPHRCGRCTRRSRRSRCRRPGRVRERGTRADRNSPPPWRTSRCR
ncbi:helix-turn-helix transcriptional regulator [Streptomyces hirsutus]